MQQALERMMVGKTSIVVAHRLSTIIRADSIAGEAVFKMGLEHSANAVCRCQRRLRCPLLAHRVHVLCTCGALGAAGVTCSQRLLTHAVIGGQVGTTLQQEHVA